MNVRRQLKGLLARQGDWKKMMETAARMKPGGADPLTSTQLAETQNFGSNPGNLKMFSYLPREMADDCALLVVLHGCTQTAAGYEAGAGWSTLADRFGFALLLPEQQRSNNPNGCFNWFQTGDIERGHGEAESIRQMVSRMISAYEIDPARVFVTGLSAGGAMTSVLLATYPEVFAGGAIIAGLPYGAANNVQQALENMYQCRPRPARQWGDLVRKASPHFGRWPRVSVWHGGADKTVIPANATEIIKQWTDVHRLPVKPSREMMVDGYPRQVWIDSAGEELIECFTIPAMAHGTPLAVGMSEHQCGIAGPFLLEVGISSSYHIARFFGLADARRSPGTTGRDIEKYKNWKIPPAEPLEGEVLEPDLQSPTSHPRFDIGAIITDALKTAGLMKGD
jgi:poly(hydroxyalkanoate) depolymerase family esterase